ncbi:MAG: hypothetical protein NT047_00750 [Deltaproteobacteria bacterium]|nr:hypothetical protein [Deltaproteobacteria bacterium]
MLKPGTDYVIGSDSLLKDAREVDPAFSVVGGFHTLCADAGKIPGHPLSGYREGDPLPCSLWNLNHRAKCGNNAGMVYDRVRDLWVDIYLHSDPDRKIISESLDNYETIANKIGKRLPTHEEFSSLAEGSNELTNIAGSKFHPISGGHKDTLGQRMISDIGCEDCAGLVWQWLKTNDPSDESCRLIAGGGWNSAAICGSRCRAAYYYRWGATTSIGARFVSEPLNPRERRQAQ